MSRSSLYVDTGYYVIALKTGKRLSFLQCVLIEVICLALIQRPSKHNKSILVYARCVEVSRSWRLVFHFEPFPPLRADIQAENRVQLLAIAPLIISKPYPKYNQLLATIRRAAESVSPSIQLALRQLYNSPCLSLRIELEGIKEPFLVVDSAKNEQVAPFCHYRFVLIPCLGWLPLNIDQLPLFRERIKLVQFIEVVSSLSSSRASKQINNPTTLSTNTHHSTSACVQTSQSASLPYTPPLSTRSSPYCTHTYHYPYAQHHLFPSAPVEPPNT
eukprot:TRINITY_DN10626_c0_g1_i1.p1 TRINITY_DN10626_c0_g1~~TRINITY_DN10626_c0_g1_i1.p1  ORF type:complete len:273 (-),score=-36.37 TRINITY_DN10626_c0_g1_i1:355-1173(-)